MADVKSEATVESRRNEKVGQVVSTKMQKTIVVEVEMRKAHPKYQRIVRTAWEDDLGLLLNSHLQFS